VEPLLRLRLERLRLEEMLREDWDACRGESTRLGLHIVMCGPAS
jgi:hypothetical protein